MPLPKEQQLDGDRAFVRVNMRQDPALLDDGEVAFARNLRFDDGKAATRKGVRIMRWAQPAAPSPQPLSYGQVRAAAVYNEPIMGKEWLLVATNAKVWRSRPGQTGVEVQVPAGTGIPVGAQFIQTYNGMVLVGGRTFAPLYMTDLDEGFQPIPAIPPPKPGDAYVEPLPPCYSGIYTQSRFFGVDARPELDKVDSVWVSDFGGVTSVLQGSSAYQNFKINQGSADRLTSLFKLNDTTIIAAKTGSIHVVSGVYGDNLELANNARLDQITDEYGCSAPRSFVLVGQDAWFLADRRGVAGVRKTGLGLVQEVDIPRSRDIGPLIPRINWLAAKASVATAWGNYVYFAVPMDGADYNNAVLVYSILNQGWCGFDDGPAIDVLAWVKFTLGGEKRLGFVSSTGFICLYEDGRADEVGTVVEGADVIQRTEIQTELVTRAYGGRLAGVKQFGTLGGKMATLDPVYEVLLRHDGVNEEWARATVTKDRTRYYRPVGAAPYQADNANDDFLVPYRQDYSLYWPATGLIFKTKDSVIALELLQEFEESWDFRHRGQYLQAVLRSTRGHLSVGGLMVDYRFARDRRGGWA
jgi:hypothetical protein